MRVLFSIQAPDTPPPNLEGYHIIPLMNNVNLADDIDSILIDHLHEDNDYYVLGQGQTKNIAAELANLYGFSLI